ncbi:MAG: carboxymuconolactone decarboxylase family protein [Candidatus Baltobacteraceae bacterium]
MSRRLGVEQAMLDELWDFARNPKFTDAERAALAAAVAITREPRGLPEPVWQDLRNHFDDGEIVEILCAVGLFNYFNRLNNALQMEVTK